MRKLLSLLTILVPFISIAQAPIPNKPQKRCATFEVAENFRRQNPGTETELQFESWLRQKKQSTALRTQATATLPVIFHIIYSNASDNVSQAAIQQQVLQLNKDFANQSNSRYSAAANTEIQFALAKTDPSGTVLAEPGIDRILFSSKGFSAPPYTVGETGTDDYLGTTIKPATIWDPTRYLNIWILQISGDAAGVSTVPASSGLPGLSSSETNSTAGIAIIPQSVGSVFSPSSCNASYGMGRTLTHEMGHFLGLRHIWGDATCGTDYVDDTPAHEDRNFGVPTHPKPNNCGTADEMFENYMDYSDDKVLNTFTVGQVARMQTVLLNSPRRSSLVSSTVETIAVSATNSIAFTECAGSVAITETGITGNTSRYRDHTFTITVEDKATGNATITINTAGTAENGTHYQVLTPSLTVAAGDQYKSVSIRVFDNALVEADRTILLSYSIAGTGVTAGSSAQAITIVIRDDDNAIVTQNSITMFSQNWETSTAGWSTLTSSNFPNRFVASPIGDAGGSGNAAHITNNTTTFVNEYQKDQAGLAILRSPLINASGLRNLQVNFKYKVWGESVSGTPVDFGLLVYAPATTPNGFTRLSSRDAGPYFGTTAIVSGNPTVSLPDATFANRSFYLGWYWENDDSDGNDPGLNVDDIVLTASGTPVETTVSSSHSFGVQQGSGIHTFRSTNDRMVAQLTNAGTALSGVVASVTAAGSGQVPVTTSAGTYQRTQKVFQITPSTPAGSTSYRVTLYFTSAELAVWGANKLNLQVLKVKDGVSLTQPISSSNAVVVSPVSATEDAAAEVITYTADFTDGFSQYMLVSAGFTLPVNLVVFEAQPDKKNIRLRWETATEHNNKGFDVERSTDGVTYQSIGWVKGAGTTQATTRYQHTDHFVQPNTLYYYRLKQVDADNGYRYSAVRQAKIAEEGITVSVSPNPVKGRMRVFVAGATQPVDIMLVNSKGQQAAMWRKVTTGAGYEINTSRFGKGVYTVNVRVGNKEYSTQVVIQ